MTPTSQRSIPTAHSFPNDAARAFTAPAIALAMALAITGAMSGCGEPSGPPGNNPESATLPEAAAVEVPSVPLPTPAPPLQPPPPPPTTPPTDNPPPQPSAATSTGFPADVTMVMLEVSDRSGAFDARSLNEPLPDLFMPSSANGWDPAAGRGELQPQFSVSVDGQIHRGWILMVTPEIAAQPGLEFKFTRGDWATVEVAEDGADIPNRTFSGVNWSELQRDDDGRVYLPLTIQGFADQRAGRWPMQTSPPAPNADGSATTSAAPSTVVGDLRIRSVRAMALGGRPRTVRIWLPPGYDDPANAQRRYPVLYMHDAQNLFDAATSGFGMEWRVDETMTRLIAEGAIPPWIVVGIDHAGEQRVGELSIDGVEVRGQIGFGSRYLSFLVDELIPWVAAEYRTIESDQHRAIGGASCGGNITVQAILERPGVFSRALIESPALWIGDGVLIRRMQRHTGPMPARAFVAMGSREYNDPARDASLVDMANQLFTAMNGKAIPPGADAPLLFSMIEDDAAHNEDAWARRLPTALKLLLTP